MRSDGDTHSRLRTVPTSLGIKGVLFYGLIVLAFYAAPYTNLFFLLLSFLTALAIASTWWTRNNVKGVTGELLAIEPMPAGAGQDVLVQLQRKRDTGCVLACRLEFEEHRELLFANADPKLDRVPGRIGALDRGVYPVRNARLESTWPLGLWRTSREIPAPAELIVYPAPKALPDARSKAELIAETFGASVAAAGDFGPAGVREFRSGDDPRLVDWKATARRGSLAVKEWEADATTGLEICLDQRCSPEDLEAALSLITSLALMTRENKETFRLYAQGERGTFGGDHRDWNELWRFLAGCQPLAASAEPPPPCSRSVLQLPHGRIR